MFSLILQVVVSVPPYLETSYCSILQLFIIFLKSRSSNCLDLGLDFEIIVVEVYLSSFVLDFVTICEIYLGPTEESLKYTGVRNLQGEEMSKIHQQK